jgi:predicted alpha-1,2-mannosidase
MKNLTKVILLIIPALIFMTGCDKSNKVRYTDYVNTMVGTDGHGHTFPGAALPGGMVQLSPDTDIKGWDWCSGYHYSDSSIMGFSHLHRSGMGAGDWGDILLMPLTGDLKIKAGDKANPDEGYRSGFSHDDEISSPGYYSVLLKDYDIKAELTVTPRTGFHKYTFPESDNAHIIIDMHHGISDSCLNAMIEIVNDNEIAGYRESKGFVKNQKVYFYARFSKPFNSSGTWKGEDIIPGSKKESGQNIGAFINYVTSDEETIKVKVGISYTGIDQARLNMETEIPHWNFAKVKEQGSEIWNKALGKIEVHPNENDDNAKQKLNTFYTAMYHSLLFPATFGDVDGKYTGLDNNIHTAEDFTYLSDFSLWDTYRAEMPLLALIEPERNSNAINTMIAQYQQGGWLPTPQQFGNCYTNDMIGDHPAPAILDAFMKDISNFDAEKAYQAVKKNATEIPPADHRSKGRVGLKYYLEYEYIPYDQERQSVSRTLEYAYNDWCVAQFAKALGKDDDYTLFSKRALYYKNVLDTLSRFARPKKSDGSWLEPFDPKFIGHGAQRHYTEANAWQYTWFVPHNVAALIEFLGGKEKFTEKLDSLFSVDSDIPESVPDVTGLIGQYAHGNEPSHHITYLYNYAGLPWKTQKIVREVMENFYDDGPAGLCGNEDMGQMSAWYIMSAMGFYPVAPGQNDYSIGSPLFSKIIIHPDEKIKNIKKFTVEVRNNSAKNKYIQSASLNGIPLNKPFFDHAEIKNGETLVFQMGPEPNKKWGVK